jgi:hypothetical protein
MASHQKDKSAPSLHPGYRQFEEPWSSFYLKYKDSPGRQLIKTHEPPMDQNPAIYVVRDGRQAIYSYLHYHRHFHPDHPVTLLDLVLGKDVYGNWSQHYQNWSKQPECLILRYDELVQASPSLVQRIAEFLGHEGSLHPWLNPFDDLHKKRPWFYRKGSTIWERPAEWSDTVDGAFWAIHGDLMTQLGYGEKPSMTSALTKDWQVLSEALHQDRKSKRPESDQKKFKLLSSAKSILENLRRRRNFFKQPDSLKRQSR